MRFWIRALALSVLPLAACAGYIGWGYGWGYCDPYYDPYCYDYSYAPWKPGPLAAEDFNDDGHLDLAVSDGQAGRVWVVFGDGSGGFLPTPAPAVGGASPGAVAALQANGDAFPDLVVLDGAPGLLCVHLGDGVGGFTAVPPALNAALLPSVRRFARGRLDGDAFDDLVVLHPNGGVHVALGTGAGTFVEAGSGDPAAAFLGPEADARIEGIHLAVGAFDASAGADLLVLDAERFQLAIFSGNGDGTFGAAHVLAFRVLGEVLDVAPVHVRDPARDDLAILFLDESVTPGIGILAVVSTKDGQPDTDPVLVNGARGLLARDLDGDGRTDLLLSDADGGEVRVMYARTR